MENSAQDKGEEDHDPKDKPLPDRNDRGASVDLSLFERIAMRLFGSVYIGHRKRPGWRGQLPMYAFRCPRHGVVVNYPQGYDERLECPLCLREGSMGSDR